MLNSTFSGLKRCRCWQYVSKLYLHLFSSCCHPNLRNSAKIRTYSSSRSSKVIDLDANRKRICNFLLTLDVYPNFFEILTFKAIDNGWFSSPSLLVWRTRLRQPVRISADETYPAKIWCIVSTVWWQESPAIADKPARRESLPKLLQFDVLTTSSLPLRHSISDILGRSSTGRHHPYTWPTWTCYTGQTCGTQSQCSILLAMQQTKWFLRFSRIKTRSQTVARIAERTASQQTR